MFVVASVFPSYPISLISHRKLLFAAVVTPPICVLRGGAGFYGTPFHAVKCLQIALSGYNPGESASEEGLVEGYGLPFNIQSPSNPHVRQPHPVLGECAGLHLSPDGPHESNHSDECKNLFCGLKTCRELASVDFNPHGQNASKKKKL